MSAHKARAMPSETWRDYLRADEAHELIAIEEAMEKWRVGKFRRARIIEAAKNRERAHEDP
ncbi:hypothetical protein ACRC7T_06380 [Segnochrobactraceae bacterium EtOH-i3]